MTLQEAVDREVADADYRPRGAAVTVEGNTLTLRDGSHTLSRPIANWDSPWEIRAMLAEWNDERRAEWESGLSRSMVVALQSYQGLLARVADLEKVVEDLVGEIEALKRKHHYEEDCLQCGHCAACVAASEAEFESHIDAAER